MNAFDVVRLHKFGYLDAKASEDTDSVKLPSFKAMQDFASGQDAVKETLAKEREKAAKDDFEDDLDGRHVLYFFLDTHSIPSLWICLVI